MHTALDVVVHTEEAYWPVVHGLQGVHVAELTVVEYVLPAVQPVRKSVLTIQMSCFSLSPTQVKFIH